MKTIKLTHNKIALVDDEDFESLNQSSWHIRKGKKDYARGTFWDKEKKKPVLKYMHRVILKVNENDEIDHIDGNGLNNQKSNLRICSRSENNQNAQKSPNKTSKFKGVVFDKKRNKYRACIYPKGKRIFLGRFETEIEAALAYNEMAIALYGQFARINEIEK